MALQCVLRMFNGDRLVGYVVKSDTTQQRDPMFMQDLVELIESAQRLDSKAPSPVYVGTAEAGTRVDVRVRHDADGKAFLQSASDARGRNNLELLPIQRI
jgi:hypothetical protein